MITSSHHRCVECTHMILRECVINSFNKCKKLLVSSPCLHEHGTSTSIALISMLPQCFSLRFSSRIQRKKMPTIDELVCNFSLFSLFLEWHFINMIPFSFLLEIAVVAFTLNVCLRCIGEKLFDCGSQHALKEPFRTLHSTQKSETSRLKSAQCTELDFIFWRFRLHFACVHLFFYAMSRVHAGMLR